MTHKNELPERKPPRMPDRMHTGCVGYLLTGLVLVAAILALVATWGAVIAGALAGIGA